MKIAKMNHLAVLLCLLLGASLVFSQDVSTNTNSTSTNAPAGARRGNRGGPLNEADRA